MGAHGGPPDDLSRAMFRRRLRAYARDVHNDLSYPYFIFENATGALVGGVTLSNVRRGSAQTAALGYWMGALRGQGPHARRRPDAPAHGIQCFAAASH